MEKDTYGIIGDYLFLYSVISIIALFLTIIISIASRHMNKVASLLIIFWTVTAIAGFLIAPLIIAKSNDEELKKSTKAVFR